jgi:hypothetical protein
MSTTAESPNYKNLVPAFVLFADVSLMAYALGDGADAERATWLQDAIKTCAHQVGGSVELVQLTRQRLTDDEILRPAHKADFDAFALSAGFTLARARRAWGSTQYVIARQQTPILESFGAELPGSWSALVRPATDPALTSAPPLRSTVSARDPILDLESVRERLVATDFDPAAWIRATPATIDFLAQISMREA